MEQMDENINSLHIKELKENYLSEFEVFVCLKNPKIHVIKNYNLHRIYEKANGREID